MVEFVVVLQVLHNSDRLCPLSTVDSDRYKDME